VTGIELQLLRGEGAPGRHDGREVAAVEIHTFNPAVVLARPAHDRPVDVAAVGIDHDAIGRT
jgi:hypothetical protein